MSLIKNSIWNFIGTVAPVIVSIPALGYMARVLGTEKFGLYTLIFAVLGYASLFDLGLSRSIIREVANLNGDRSAIKKIIGTASLSVFFLSLFAAAVLYFCADQLVHVLSISGTTYDDALSGIEILSLTIPLLLLSSVWFAYLEGESSFGLLNVLRGLTSLLIALFPAIFVFFNPSFYSAVLGLLLGRFVTAIVAYISGLGIYRSAVFVFDFKSLKRLLSFGGWITLSNIISPLLVYFDRFFISNMLGGGMVARYSVPAEAVSRLLLVPQSVARVVFQKLSSKSNDSAAYSKVGGGVIFFTSISLAAALFVFSKEILVLWVGSDYGGVAVTVLRIMLVGFVFNSLAQIPFLEIQARGNSRLTAKVHALEIIPYLAALYFAVSAFGLVGAAVVWTVRMAVDYFVFLYLSKINHSY